MIHIRQQQDFGPGYTPITAADEAVDSTLMDFGVLRLTAGQKHSWREEDKELALVLLYGRVELLWSGGRQLIDRPSCFDHPPWVLHLPRQTAVEVVGVAGDNQLAVVMTVNQQQFAARLYSPSECRSEERGKGTMNETSTRIVRTVFDYDNAPYSNLVVGEVVGFPGKWSSYPPHHHPQPEIYHYRFDRPQGYGFCELGDGVVKLRHNDTVKILDGLTHPQVTAPGYAMCYLWLIRHLDGNPYRGPEYPVFVPDHLWVTEPGAVIWPNKRGAI
ncbi:MAG: 5-deoxy-glucuronate isomerase [Negativicutes bacterium]|nr:5-deoxy-glucuronate isomerase [Negativicutes bacterium]